MWFYDVFGLHVGSNLPLPGLVSGPRKAMDVTIELGLNRLPLADDEPKSEILTSSVLGPQGVPILRVFKSARSGAVYFIYDDGAWFLIDQEARHISGGWPEELRIEDIAPYLLGAVLGYVLRIRNIVCLHASAVSIDGQAIALVGASGYGKSTTAAAFASIGFPVLTDDVVALSEADQSFLVRPGIPRLSLWPSAAQLLFGAPDALPRISPHDPNWNKLYLDLTADRYHFQAEPLPLGAIYLLGGSRPASDGSRVTGTIPHEALIALIGHTYDNFLLDREQRAREFDVLARLVSAVPIRLVHRSANPSPFAVRDDILQDLQARVLA